MFYPAPPSHTHPPRPPSPLTTHRFDDGRYAAFKSEVEQFIGQERIFTDPVRTFAYGTDASFYRLNPKMVIKVSERVSESV